MSNQLEITIRFQKIDGFGPLHQEGFVMSQDGKKLLTYNTSLPAGLPYVVVEDGPNEGIWLPVSNSSFMEDLAHFLKENQ